MVMLCVVYTSNTIIMWELVRESADAVSDLSHIHAITRC